jgi:hypothetical protein
MATTGARAGERPAFGKPLSLLETAVEKVHESYRWIQEKIDESEIFAYEEVPSASSGAKRADGDQLSMEDMFSPRAFERLANSSKTSANGAPGTDADAELPAAMQVIRAHQQNKLRLAGKHGAELAKTARAARKPIGGGVPSGMSSAPGRVSADSVSPPAAARPKGWTIRFTPRFGRGRTADKGDASPSAYEA